MRSPGLSYVCLSFIVHGDEGRKIYTSFCLEQIYRLHFVFMYDACMKRWVFLLQLLLLFALAACVRVSSCPQGSDPVMCRYDDVVLEVTNTVASKNPSIALDRLRQILHDEPELESLCHGLVHEIGHAAYKKEGFEKALSYEDDLCGSGYIHGIVETHLDRVRDIEAVLPTICDPDAATCFHGIGHGLMYKLNNDLQKSVALCGTFTKDFQRIQCAEGVFMETYDSETRFHASEYLKEDDPFFACRGLDAVNEGVCAFYATRYFLRLHPRDYNGAIQWCLHDVPAGPRDACIKGVGDSAMKQNINDPLFVESVCETVPLTQRHYCIEGLVSYAIVHEARAGAGAVICPELLPENRSACWKMVKEGERAY